MSAQVPIGQFNTMMNFGSFQFSVRTAAYQELNRHTEYNWPSQQRFGKRPSSQFVGIGEETITLPGIIYPEYRGGFHQIEAMRTMASSGTPLMMVDGNGVIMGKWVIVSVDEKQSTFAAFGAPRKMEFTLNLKYFYEEPVTIAKVITAATGTTASVVADTSTLGKLKTQASSALETITSGVNTAITSVKGAIDATSAAVNEATAVIEPVMAKTAQVYSAAVELFDLANTAKTTVQNVNSITGIITAMGTVSAAASKLSQAGTAASPIAVDATGTLSSSGASAAAVSATRQAATSVGNSTVTATRAYTAANNVIRSANQ